MKPLSGGAVNAPYHSEDLLPASMNIREGGTVFAGLDTERVAEIFPDLPAVGGKIDPHEHDLSIPVFRQAAPKPDPSPHCPAQRIPPRRLI